MSCPKHWLQANNILKNAERLLVLEFGDVPTASFSMLPWRIPWKTFKMNLPSDVERTCVPNGSQGTLFIGPIWWKIIVCTSRITGKKHSWMSISMMILWYSL
jgi:hypothetical protein